MRLRDVCNLQQCARAPSVKLVCVGGQPPRTASARAHAPCLQQLEQLAGRCGQELELLAGRCGAGVCAAGVFALARAACVRAGACGLELLVCAGVFACVRRACVRVRCWRACGCARALAVQLTTATLSATGIRKTCSGRVCRGSSWRFGSGRVGSLKVQVVKVLK